MSNSITLFRNEPSPHRSAIKLALAGSSSLKPIYFTRLIPLVDADPWRVPPGQMLNGDFGQEAVESSEIGSSVGSSIVVQWYGLVQAKHLR